MIARLFLAIVVALAPVATAAVLAIDCPPHAHHCTKVLPPLTLPGGEARAELDVMSDGAAVAYPPASVSAGATATLVVRVRIDDTVNESHNVTVTVNETAGIAMEEGASQTALLAPGASHIFEFALDLDPELSAHDILFVPLTMSAPGADLSYSHVAIAVAPDASPPPPPDGPGYLLASMSALLGALLGFFGRGWWPRKR